MKLLRPSLLLAAGALVLAACNPANKPATPPDTGVAAEAAQPAGDIPAPPDVAAPPATAEKTKTGLASVKLTAGTGTVTPQKQDTVKVHYTGWTTDGKMFDSSVKRGQPAEFPLGQVIKGWTEGVQLMVVGEKRRFWIPQDLAYQGRPGAPAGMLVFDVELLGIKPGPKPIPAPADVAAPPADAQNKNGVFYKVLTPGTGRTKPEAQDTVKVHYTGWTTDGEMFDSSVVRGEPIEFPLNRVIKGWSEGVQQMVEGEKARLWIPQDLAYQGRPGAPAGMLVFDIELLSVKPGPKPIPAPKDVAAAPKSAKSTASGIKYVVLKKGNGKDKPTATSRVEVHYTGWTTDGKMFDSSVQRGQPATFGLNQVIPGWTEGVQLMSVGEKTRFWIPEALAYKGQPGAPAGMLVFEVELLK
ncbi:FKBP-type peptidyl-prolyl cis-trans isomerase, partial [Myxococcota bacterium]|nr:FKBP-type peptidyl-prolyl cis-trans isomerase [Myxococcota bacterium]